MDPGFIIYFANDSSLHQCLGLTTVSATGYGFVITPPKQGAKYFLVINVYYVTGGTAAQSAVNFERWFETIVCSMTTTNNPIVTGPVGTVTC